LRRSRAQPARVSADKAAEALSLMAETLKREKPGEKASESTRTGYRYNQAIYWQATAKVAEVQERRLDALMAYQTALAFRPAAPQPPQTDELSGNAQRLWKELGGTDQGWQAYLARNDASKAVTEAATATWDPKNTPLPDFVLTDLKGRKWTLSDLKGKVAFINLWETWCGPCLMELPFVEKLSLQMKPNRDVLILTLNIDEQVGLVEPFMKAKKFSFPVLFGQEYAVSLGVYSIPRNWVVTVDGKLVFEGLGFSNDGEAWLKKAQEMIHKAKSDG
jgi:thiol-disulfide isomerase/thioredoxin